MPGLDNRRKRVEDSSDGPWLAWTETDRAERAIRFIETYCRMPKGHAPGQPLELAPFQKAWLREVLAPGVTSAVMQVPRGNGKSSLLAAVATWAVFDPDESGAPQVPVVATAVHQAVRSVYGVAMAMVEAEPALRSRSIVFTAIGATKISVPMTFGEMFPSANEVSGLQGLDPSLAVCDEIGFMGLDAWNSLLLAGVKRPRSLVVGIGTPGLDKDNALWHLRQKALIGDLPGFVFTEYAAMPDCRVDDEAEWRAANPALEAGFLNLDSMRTNLQLAPEGRFRVFHLGQWVEGVESWLGPDARRLWDSLACPESPPQADLSRRMWVGLDVGFRHDSTALVAVQRLLNGTLYAEAQFWIPEADQAVELTHVMEALRELDREYDVAEIAYDPRLFEVPAQMLADEGLPMVEFNQSVERMTPAFGQLFEMIKRREISHDGGRMFAEHILNAIPRYNERGFVLAKAKSRGKIDACYALAMAVDRALKAAPPRPPLVVL